MQVEFLGRIRIREGGSLKFKLCSFAVNEPVFIPTFLGINKLLVSCLVIQHMLIGLLLGARLVLGT
jgi:hypothetical protein